MRYRFNVPLLYTLLCSQLLSCTLGPDYVRPPVTTPLVFKENKDWKQATPRDNVLIGDWWAIYRDPKLHELERQVAIANQSIRQAEAQYRQAQHMVQSAQSAYAPTVNINNTVNRFRSATGQTQVVPGVRKLFGSLLSIAWEPDIWGSVRRQVEANTDTAQASAATLQALRLSLQATLAQNYFQIKALDAQKALLDETVASYSKVLQITRNRYAVGIQAKSDVAQAETQLESVRAQAINLGIQRAQLEHAIAVLIGKTPAELSLTAAPLTIEPPAIPKILPAELLERRPDIAAAERTIAAANAQIGVAKAAFFPTLNLAASNGYQSSTIDTLFTMARRYWALGPAGLAFTMFDGGAKNATYKQTKDTYEANVAAYRQTVLTGFQEVEDNLASLRILEEEAQVQAKAVAAAELALKLTINQYQAGTISYLNVMTAQTAALSNHQTAVQLQGQRLIASVLLVKALGGGWNVAMLPKPDEAGGVVKWTDMLMFPMD